MWSLYFLAATCFALNGPSNGGISFNTNPINNRYPVGTKGTFFCNSGYSRSGPPYATCNKQGTILYWSYSGSGTPSCTRKEINIYIILNYVKTFLFLSTKQIHYVNYLHKLYF